MGIVSRSQGGGGAPLTRRGFAVRLAATTGILGDNTTVPFDTVMFDTDAFFNTGTHIATIPAGLGGTYIISASFQVTGTSETVATPVFAYLSLATTGNWPNVNVAAGLGGFTNPSGAGGGGHVAQYDVGDTITPKLRTQLTTAELLGGGNGAVFAMLRVTA